MALCAGNYISLCTGGGGLELGVRLGSSGLPPSAPHQAGDDPCGISGVDPVRPVAYVERDLIAATLLAHRIETSSLAPAPIWSDLKSFDFAAWRGRVDGIVGGYPCQPFSYAGARRGEDDPRHLWPAIAAGIRDDRTNDTLPTQADYHLDEFTCQGCGYLMETGDAYGCPNCEGLGLQAQPMLTDGEESSESALTSRRRLNPTFVEGLQGWPLGWTSLVVTDCESWGTASSPSKRLEHGDSSGRSSALSGDAA